MPHIAAAVTAAPTSAASTRVRGRRRPRDWGAAIPTGAPGELTVPSSSARRPRRSTARSSACWYRRSGAFARHFAMIHCSLSGRCGFSSWIGAGSDDTICPRIVWALSPWNGRCPVTSS